MKHKKQWVIFLCMVFAFLVIRPEKAQGATVLPDSAILVNYEQESVEVAVGKNTQIFYTDNPLSLNWEIAPITDGKAIFDISWIKPGTTARVYIKGDVDSVVTARYIEAQENLTTEFVGSLSAADVVDIDAWKEVYKNYPWFSNETGYILFFLKRGGVATAFFDVTRIEWKKGDNGNWRPFVELNLAQMNAKGATIQFRLKAINDADTADKVSGKRYSTTSKLTMAKIAAAPSAAVNIASMSIGIKNGMEFSLNKKDWFLIPAYSRGATTDDMFLPVEDFNVLPYTNRRVMTVALPAILDVPANARIDEALVNANPDKYTRAEDEYGNLLGIYVYTRTAAAAKKAASKVTQVLIPLAKNKPDIKNDITVTYQQSKTGTAGIALTNNTSERDPVDYQYAIVTDPASMTAEELSDVKWNLLKSAKTIKIGSSKAPQGDYVIFRVATTAKNELPSEFEIYEYPISYDKVTFAAVATTSLFPGGEITASKSNNAIYGEVTYIWERSEAANGTYTTITSGTGIAASKYTIREEDIGYYIRVRISNVSATGEEAETISKNTGRIAKDPSKQ